MSFPECPQPLIPPLLRDALKVIGAPSPNLAPATYAYFNLNPHNPHSGGTQHTVAICKAQGVEFETL